MKRRFTPGTCRASGRLHLPLLAALRPIGPCASPFPDKNLEAAIRDVLKHEPKVELTDEKLLDIYFLEAPGKEIKDLRAWKNAKTWP